MCLQKVISRKFFYKLVFLLASWRSVTKIAGSGSISQRHGSADPDPDPDPNQNVMDPGTERNTKKILMLTYIWGIEWPALIKMAWKWYNWIGIGHLVGRIVVTNLLTNSYLRYRAKTSECTSMCNPLRIYSMRGSIFMHFWFTGNYF